MKAIRSSRRRRQNSLRAAPERLNELAVWNLASGTRVRRARTNGYCWAAAFTADRSLALCQNGELWDVATLTRLPTPHWARVSHAAFSPNGSLLAIGPGFRLEIWDVKRLSRVHSVGSGGFATESLALRRMGALSPSAAIGVEVALWDAITGKGSRRRRPPVASTLLPRWPSLLMAGRCYPPRRDARSSRRWRRAVSWPAGSRTRENFIHRDRCRARAGR